MGAQNNESQLRALRVPHELDTKVSEEMGTTGDNRTVVMIRWLERGAGIAGPAEVDWEEFDKQVHKAMRHTNSVARSLRAARGALGLK